MDTEGQVRPAESVVRKRRAVVLVTFLVCVVYADVLASPLACGPTGGPPPGGIDGGSAFDAGGAPFDGAGPATPIDAAAGPLIDAAGSSRTM
jgi:hypothetical protein